MTESVTNTNDAGTAKGVVAPRSSHCYTAMRFAYADPPYYGLAAKFYGDQHSDAAEYDKLETHQKLVDRLCSEFPDGWAMSLQAKALRDILPLCPEDVRVMAWVKSFASFKLSNKSAQWAWEPVIVRGGRPFEGPHCVRDWVKCRMAMKKGFRGAKPEMFVLWILEVLNVRQSDEFVDLFPGSGGVSRAVEAWKRQKRLPFEAV